MRQGLVVACLAGLVQLGDAKLGTYRRPIKNVLQSTDDQEQSVSIETCQRSMDRLRGALDFNEVLKNLPEGERWKDSNFAYPDTLRWEDMRSLDDHEDIDHFGNYYRWERISNVYGADEYSLWGTTEVSFKDTRQGALGDCWLHAAASAVSTDPERIRKIFQIDDKNSAGLYALNMYVMGIPVTVTVDDFI